MADDTLTRNNPESGTTRELVNRLRAHAARTATRGGADMTLASDPTAFTPHPR